MPPFSPYYEGGVFMTSQEKSKIEELNNQGLGYSKIAAMLKRLSDKNRRAFFYAKSLQPLQIKGVRDNQTRKYVSHHIILYQKSSISFVVLPSN